MTNYEKMYEKVVENGMERKVSKVFIKKLKDDEMEFTVNAKDKEWALKRGFFPGRIEMYGLNEDNYRKFLPDFTFYMLHPYNNHFKIWVNDKLTLKYLLNSCGCESSMPEYYLYIENDGNYTYLMDAPSSINKDENFIFNLLKAKKSLAMKPNDGEGGQGFMKFKWENGNIWKSNDQICLKEFNEIIRNLPNYTITEYVYQHSDLSKIWKSSECTLRVVMAKIPEKSLYSIKKWRCLISYARFGSAISKGASNMASGGIGVGFDYQTGKLNFHGYRYKKFCNNGEYMFKCHPDTNTIWNKNLLPNWEYAKELIDRICQHISSLDYLGFDIIITQDGIKLCEINTLPDLNYEQIICKPVLENNETRLFFENKGMNNINTEELYDLYMECQI